MQRLASCWVFAVLLGCAFVAGMFYGTATRSNLPADWIVFGFATAFTLASLLRLVAHFR